jgi:purine-binding chemotaxis protein CheW
MSGDGSPEFVRVLLCRVGAQLCALPLEHVVETMRPLPTESLPGAPPFVLGLSTIRGTPIPVVDAGVLLCSGDPPKLTRFVSVKAGHRRVVLAVGEVLGVQDISTASLCDLPPLLGEVAAGVVSAVGALDSALLLVLEAARIASEAERKWLEPQSIT